MKKLTKMATRATGCFQRSDEIVVELQPGRP
jgi:hypothetical protein